MQQDNQKSRDTQKQNILLQVLKNSAAPEQFRIYRTNQYVYSDSVYTVTSNWTSSRRLKQSEVESAKKFKEEIVKRTADSPSEDLKYLKNFTYQVGLDVGDEMVEVRGLQKFHSKQEGTYDIEDTTFVPQKGVLYLLSFWEGQTDNNDGYLSEIAQMQKKNKNSWDGKVKAVSLLFSLPAQGFFERTLNKSWRSVEHFRVKDDTDDFESYKKFCEKLPFIMIIDSDGKIAYKGSYDQINVENYINSHISGTALPVVKDTKVDQGITRQEFKLLKQFLKNDWKKYVQEKNVKQRFNLYLSKKIEVDLDGKVIAKTYGKLEVVYIIFENKEIAQKGVDLLKKLPEGLVFFEYAIFTNPEQERSNHIAFFKSLASEYGLDLKLQLEEIIDFELNRSLYQKSQIIQEESFGPENYTHSREIIKKIKKYFNDNPNTKLEEFGSLYLGFDFSLQTGKPYQSIKNLQVNGSENVITLNHEPGKIYLIDLWTSNWYGTCIDRFYETRALIKKNKSKWEGKLKYIAISVEDIEDSNFSDLRTKEILQNDVELYFLKDEQGNPFYFKYEDRNLPRFLLVGQDGLLKSKDQEFDVETKVNELIDGLQGQNAQEEISEEQVTKLLSFLSDKDQISEYKEEKSKISKQQVSFEIYITSEQSLQGNNQKKTYRPSLLFNIREVDRVVLDQLLTKVYDIIPESCWNLKGRYVKLVDIPIGDKCSLCQKILNDQTQQYYSPFTKTHFCVECAEYQDTTQVGLNRYKVKDTVVFINAPLSNPSDLQGIQEDTFGKNLRIGEQGDHLLGHNLSCQGLCQDSKYGNGPRYILISNKPSLPSDDRIDFCQTCFEAIKQRNSEDALKIETLNQKVNLKVDTLYLRILFHQRYYEY